MSVQSSLLKPIYVAYAFGDIGGKMIYDEPFKIYAQVEDVKSLVLRESVGLIQNYDRIVIVPHGKKTQFIDEQSLLWIDVQPNGAKTNSDYKIERVGDVINGKIFLYCNSLTPNTKSLYYEKEGKVYQIKADFDNTNLVAILPLNKYFPIDTNTKVWSTKPTSTKSLTNLLRLVKKQKLSKSYKFTFERVEE